MSVEFLNWIKHNSDSDVDEIEDMIMYIQNVVSNNDSLKKEGLEVWVENMEERLDTKKVKYAKALDRILTAEESATPVNFGAVYHCAQYKDLDGLVKCSTSKVVERMNLPEHSRNWGEEKMSTMWKYVHELNRCAFEGCERVQPRVPSRDEIQKSIKSKKQDNTAANLSMSRAFIIAYNALYESVNGEAIKVDDDTAQKKKEAIMARLKEESSSGTDVGSVLGGRDVAARSLAAKLMPDINIYSSTELRDSDWDMIMQIYTMCTMENAVPSKIMSQVEHFAQKMTGDIMSGKGGFPDLTTLEKMSDDLMSNLSTADMSKLTDSMDSLLPALQMLKGMQK